MNCDRFQSLLASQLDKAWQCKPFNEEGQEGLVLTTTFLLPNNDCIEIAVEQQNGEFLFHDFHNAFLFLQANGIDLSESSEESRYDRILSTANSYGMEFNNLRLSKRVSEDRLWEGLSVFLNVVKQTCALVEDKRERRARRFSERAYNFFNARGSRVKANYERKGLTQKCRFDLALNGRSMVLVNTISLSNPYKIKASIQRAWYKFDDLFSVEEDFTPAIIYEDEEAEQRDAWRKQHFRMLKKRSIKSYAFHENRDQLERLAEEHK